MIVILILILKSCGGSAENVEKRTENRTSTTQNTVKKENVIKSDKTQNHKNTNKKNAKGDKQ